MNTFARAIPTTTVAAMVMAAAATGVLRVRVLHVLRHLLRRPGRWVHQPRLRHLRRRRRRQLRPRRRHEARALRQGE